MKKALPTVALTFGVLFSALCSAATTEVVLHHSSGGGAVPLAVKPDISDLKFVCDAIGGTKALVTSEADQGFLHWFKVEAQNGNCKGKSGWVSSEHIQLS